MKQGKYTLGWGSVLKFNLGLPNKNYYKYTSKRWLQFCYSQKKKKV